jgi:hypothetical protein
MPSSSTSAFAQDNRNRHFRFGVPFLLLLLSTASTHSPHLALSIITSNMSSSNDKEITKRKSRIRSQNEKQEAGNKKRMEASKKELEPFLLRSMRDKKFWASDFCVPLRKWAQCFTANPSNFPMPLNDSPRFDATEPDPSLVTRPKLDKNFI